MNSETKGLWGWAATLMWLAPGMQAAKVSVDAAMVLNISLNSRNSDSGGSRTRGRARAGAEQPTWAHRVWYREMLQVGTSHRESQTGPSPELFPRRSTHLKHFLTDPEQHRPTYKFTYYLSTIAALRRMAKAHSGHAAYRP